MTYRIRIARRSTVIWRPDPEPEDNETLYEVIWGTLVIATILGTVAVSQLAYAVCCYFGWMQ